MEVQILSAPYSLKGRGRALPKAQKAKVLNHMVKRATSAAGTGDTETRPIVRRRRRRTTVDFVAQTTLLTNSLLASRAARGVMSGATHDEIVAVVTWARGIHEEDAAMRQLKTRPRRAKAEISAERIARYDVAKALLDGVTAGSVAVDISDGKVYFRSCEGA